MATSITFLYTSTRKKQGMLHYRGFGEYLRNTVLYGGSMACIWLYSTHPKGLLACVWGLSSGWVKEKMYYTYPWVNTGDTCTLVQTIQLYLGSKCRMGSVLILCSVSKLQMRFTNLVRTTGAKLYGAELEQPKTDRSCWVLWFPSTWRARGFLSF